MRMNFQENMPYMRFQISDTSVYKCILENYPHQGDKAGREVHELKKLVFVDHGSDDSRELGTKEFKKLHDQ